MNRDFNRVREVIVLFETGGIGVIFDTTKSIAVGQSICRGFLVKKKVNLGKL